MIECLEAADPRNIPAGWDGPVGGYPNHHPPWTEKNFRRFSRTYRISVQRQAFWARGNRVIDVEALAATVPDIAPFVVERERYHHQDATAYFSLSRWHEVRAHLDAHKIGPDRIRLFIADWTDHPHTIGPDVLGGNWHAWAVQFENAGPFTRTMVYGRQDFSAG